MSKISASPKDKVLAEAKAEYILVHAPDSDLDREEYYYRRQALVRKFTIYMNGIDIDKLGASDLRIASYLVHALNYDASTYLKKFSKYF